MKKLDQHAVFIPSGWNDLTHMLPTKGRFYGGQHLIARPYTFAEIEEMALDSEYNQAKAFNRAASGLKFLTPPNSPEAALSPSDIYLGDFLFALLYRKVITLGEQEFTLQDLMAGWTAEGISMESIGVKDMTAPALPATITLPSSGKEVEFWPLTLNDISGLLDEDSTSLPSISTYLNLMTRGELTAEEVVGDKDARLIEAIDDAFAHGFEPLEVPIKNKESGEEGTTEIDLNTSIFTVVLPFRPDGSDSELEITFGRPGKSIITD